MRQETVKVEGVTCQHCVQIITDALKNITGLNTVNVDLVKKEVSVEFNENKTTLQKISDKIIEVGSNYPPINRNS